jgi:hypothetical protein
MMASTGERSGTNPTETYLFDDKKRNVFVALLRPWDHRPTGVVMEGVAFVQI